MRDAAGVWMAATGVEARTCQQTDDDLRQASSTLAEEDESSLEQQLPGSDALADLEDPGLLSMPTSTPILLPTPEAAAASVGPSMAMAVAAAEERWGVERLRLEAELASLREQRERDAEAMQQTSKLVSMLQVSRMGTIPFTDSRRSCVRESSA